MGQLSRITYCCSQFAAAAAQTGHSGSSIRLQRSSRFGFAVAILEVRIVDQQDDEKLATLAELRDVRIVIAWEQSILYCPYCGASIRKFYKKAELPEADEVRNQS